jgi:hypothetical protein
MRRINGEHTLQASLYRHMSDYLSSKSDAYRIFAEAKVQRRDADEPAGSTPKNKSKKISVVDLLVVYQPPERKDSVIVGAIELKFNSRGLAKTDNIKKDLTTLSSIANRRDRGLQSELEMHRMLSEGNDVEKFRILPQKKLIYAAFCKASHSALEMRMNEKHFWNEHCPTEGRWKDRSRQPLHFGVALAKTKPVLAGQMDCLGQTEIQFFGGAFQKL